MFLVKPHDHSISGMTPGMTPITRADVVRARLAYVRSRKAGR